MKNSFYISILVSIVLMYTSCAASNNQNQDTSTTSNANAVNTPTSLQFEVIKVFPHDTTAYTEGLELYHNRFIESAGNYNKSFLHQLDTTFKRIGSKLPIAGEFFAEGITVFNDKIYQLTWKEHKVFVYNATTLAKTGEFEWPYEGWGMTHNDSSIFVSTGSANIYEVDPTTFKVKRTIGVYSNMGYQSNINELEWVNGKIYANIYTQNDIIVIDPSSGQIISKLDCTNLLIKAGIQSSPELLDPGYVLNGIAYNKANNLFYLTGKCWPVVIACKIQ
jgi:glutamine cyclotransferase